MSTEPKNEFEKAAATTGSNSLLRDFWVFLRENKKWWLLPILLIMLLLGTVILMSSTALAPFIYPLF